MAPAARDPADGASFGRYFPVSTPSASGDQTIWLKPFASHSGKASRFDARHSVEYCGCDVAKRATSVTAKAASICSGVHSEMPIARTLPAAPHR